MPLSAELRATRKGYVQELRSFADSCKVQQVSDGAARSAVAAMMARLRASAKYSTVKKQAEKTFRLYDISTHFYPILPLTRARFQQNQI